MPCCSTPLLWFQPYASWSTDLFRHRATREQEHVRLHATGHLFALACQITFCSRQLWLPPRQIELQQVPGKPRNFWGIEIHATVKHSLCLEPAYTWKDWWGQSEPQGKEPNGAYERSIPIGAEPPAASDWMEIAYQMPSLLERRLKFSFHIWIWRMRQCCGNRVSMSWWESDEVDLRLLPCPVLDHQHQLVVLLAAFWWT